MNCLKHPSIAAVKTNKNQEGMCPACVVEMKKKHRFKTVVFLVAIILILGFLGYQLLHNNPLTFLGKQYGIQENR